MRSSQSTRVVAYFLYASLGVLAVFVVLSNLPSSSIERVEVYQSTHYPWLPYVTKESLAARVQSLEEQLSLTRQALQQASDSASIHQASIQRTGSAAEHKHAHVSNDVTEALSTVSASLHVQDVVRQGLSDRNSTSGLEGMPPGSTVFVTFVNGDEKYREMMLNWALHLRAVQVWHVVVAFDDKAAATCAEQDIPFIRHTDTLASGDFRADFNRFRQMGSNKPLIVQRLMDDASASTVVISDVDTVWLRDPSEFLQRHPSADVLISTDCLSHWIETHAAEVHEQVAAGNSSVRQTFYHRCGHLPGASFGRAFNTGVIMFRNRPATRKLLEQWRELLLDPEKAYAPSQRGTAFAVTDQLAFNILLEQNITPIASADPSGDWRVVLAHDQQLRLMPLPSLAFTNGHVFFYQHLPDIHGVKAYVVHATFQRHHTAGKRARMREEGLWLPESSDYFQADRLMSYTNDVQQYVTALEASAKESSTKEGSSYSPMPALLKHFHAMSYQLAALRDAFGFASALNRTLVLPRFVCYCDQDWYASILTECRMDGSDLPLPFTCPLDMLLNPGLLDKAALPPYRMESYLSDPRTPPRVSQSQERVSVYQRPQEAVAERICSNGAGGALWAGIRAGQLTEELADMHAVHVLRFEGLRPGTFGGWSALDRGQQVSLADGDSSGAGGSAGSATGTDLGSSSGAWAPGIVERFDQQYSAAIGDEAKWCCSGEQPIDVGWITWWYPLPPPLSSSKGPLWDIPKFNTPPAHCSRIEKGEAGELNVQFTKLENHPCNFMKRRWVVPDVLSDLLYANSTFRT